MLITGGRHRVVYLIILVHSGFPKSKERRGGGSCEAGGESCPFVNSQISDLVSTACGRGPSSDTCAHGRLSVPPTRHATRGRRAGNARQTLGNGVRQEGPWGEASGSGEGRLWEAHLRASALSLCLVPPPPQQVGWCHPLQEAFPNPSLGCQGRPAPGSTLGTAPAPSSVSARIHLSERAELRVPRTSHDARLTAHTLYLVLVMCAERRARTSWGVGQLKV